MKKNLFIVSFLMLVFNTIWGNTRTNQNEELVLSSDYIKLVWNKQSDGWHVKNVSVGTKSFPNPAGYYTLLYLNRRPAPNLVDLDIEGKAFTFYPSNGEQLNDGSIRFTQTLRFGEMESIWAIDPECPEDVKVSIQVKMTVDGSVSLSSPTLVTIDQKNVSWGMIPGNWYGTEMQTDINLVRQYSMGIPAIPILAKERSTMTLCPLLTTKDKQTIAVVPEPGTSADPWMKDSSTRDQNKVALSLMNRHDELSPVVYAPVMGQVGSKVTKGSVVNLGIRYVIRNSDWFPVFCHAVNGIYKLPELLNLQHNFMSLSERVSRMQKYLRDEKKSAWSTWNIRGYKVGANGSKIADAGTMYMIARNGNDSVMSTRLPFVRNYKLAQQQVEPGFFQGAALGEYGDEDGVESERGNWIEPLHTTYYAMVDFANMLLFDPSDMELKERLKLAAEKLLQWQHADGSFDVGYDRFSYKLSFSDLKDYRPTWYGLLIAYRMLGDKRYLDAAEKGARWLNENGVKKGYYLGVCGDARNIWDFATAQCAQAFIDLYDITKKEEYKTAAITTAQAYSTSIFTHPIATDKIKKVKGAERKDWEINQVGLGVEHIRGTASGGPILISSYAGLFTRIYEYTQNPIFITMARAAARGRNTYVEQNSGQAIYYWYSLDDVDKGAVVFPWHAYWQVGWITDYILSEAHLRSKGKIKFPYGFMTPKVGPHVTYGFAPGQIYGTDAELIFRPDMVKSDNSDVEYMIAQTKDKSKLYLILLSQSPVRQSATLTLDLSQLTGSKNTWKSFRNIQGKVRKATKSSSQLNFDFAPWDLNVVEIALTTK